MTQRSYSNERYRKDAKIGSTRKSAAKAKPIRKAGDVTVKREVTRAANKRKERDPNVDWSGLPTSPEIKSWRRVWWALLLMGLGLITITYLVPGLRTNERIGSTVSLIVLALSGTAIYIDLVIIRKLRKTLIEATKKPSKGKKAAAEKTSATKESGKDAS